LYGVEGKLVFEKNNVNGNNITMDFPNLKKGIYFATVNSDKQLLG